MSYWEKRQEEAYKAGEMQVNQYFMRLEKAFNQAKREIQKTVESFCWRYAKENGLTYSEAQKRLDKAELGELKDFVEKAMNNIGKYNQDVNNMSIKARMTRYQALEAQVDAILRELYAVEYEAEGTRTMQEVYGDTYYRTWYNIDQYHGFHAEFAQIEPRTIEQLIKYPFNGANFSSRLWKQKEHLQSQLMESLTTMMVQGASPQKLAGEFAKKMQSKKADAYRLLHTESSFLMSEATHAGYKEDGVEQYEILATLDSKTCGVCGKLDGKIYFVSEAVAGKNMPPFHPCCRCTDVPYYPDMPTDGRTRIARDAAGKNISVPADMTYEEWKKRFLEEDSHAELKSPPTNDNIVDIKFRSQKSSGEVREDRKTVVEAYVTLPSKVQRIMADITVDLGNPGSACDYENGIIYAASNAEKEDIYHEFGHLIEHRMMHPADVEAYKQYLVEGLTDADITQETYYNTSGQPQTVFIVHGDRFVSEYQGRIYVNSLSEAINADGSIKTERMLETISEPFRLYQKKQLNGHQEIYDFIERVLK